MLIRTGVLLDVGSQGARFLACLLCMLSRALWLRAFNHDDRGGRAKCLHERFFRGKPGRIALRDTLPAFTRALFGIREQTVSRSGGEFRSRRCSTSAVLSFAFGRATGADD
jgi:hypothetical protein